MRLTACGEGGGESAVPTSRDSASPAPAPFVDATPTSNIAYKVGYTRPALIVDRGNVTESTFGGAAAGDGDRDRDVDLFITYGNTGGPNGGGGPNRLYLNQLGDIDNDGDLDWFVTSILGPGDDQIFGLDASEFVDELLVEWPPLGGGEGPVQLGTVLRGPIAASQPRQTLVLRHPELPAQ